MTTLKIPLFECQECGHKFFSVKAAERASSGDSGCPGCGGSDIDTYTGRKIREVPDLKGVLCGVCGKLAKSHTPTDELACRLTYVLNRGPT